MILVDSSVWIEALRSQGDVKTKEHLTLLLEEDRVCICSVIKLEILGAARKSERDALDSYFSAIPSFTITESIWERSIQISRKLRDNALSIPWNDILIVSTCLEKKIFLFSKDVHFNSARKHCSLKMWERAGAVGKN